MEFARVGVRRFGSAALAGGASAAVLVAVYTLAFWQVWGPLRTWKAALAILLVGSLAMALVPGRSAGAPDRGGRARAAWPARRRVGSVAAGLLVVVAGILQSLGREVDVAAVPLVSGLCLVVSVALGVILIALGLPRERWRRRRTLAGEAPSGAAFHPTGALAAKVPIPPDPGYQGVWGGVGSRPAPPTP